MGGGSFHLINAYMKRFFLGQSLVPNKFEVFFFNPLCDGVQNYPYVLFKQVIHD